MQAYFYRLADHLQASLRGGEAYTAWLAAERSAFVRFNRGRVRQAGEVEQRYLTLRLLRGQRQLLAQLTLSGEEATDRAQLDEALQGLRGLLPVAVDDPHLLLNREAGGSEHRQPSRLPPATEILAAVVERAADADFVGFLACGPIYHGYASSFGQRDWHETATFSLDWSLHGAGDAAVKHAYAGADWDVGEFERRLQGSRRELELLQRPAKQIRPGGYRAYLTPEALAEVVGMVNAGGFSAKAQQTKRSPLLKLAAGQARLHPAVSLSECPGQGLAPAFQGEGFARPTEIPLVRNGRLAASLVSPRSAQEYGLQTNGAGEAEQAESLRMAPGELPREQALRELDSGILVGNLWYLNYADRAAGRLTGLTRFATFWVEAGEPVAPLAVMRFDDSIYRMLGSELAALTRERELLIDTRSYGHRHTGSQLLPGALLKDFRLVL